MTEASGDSAFSIMSTQITQKYYEILGLTQGAPPLEIKQAYRDMAQIWHPDRFPNSPRLQEKAQEAMKRINIAYQTLIDLEKEKSYDDSLKPQTQNPYRTATRPAPKTEEEPRTKKANYSAREAAPSSQTMDAARSTTFKHVERWLKLVRIVNKLQTQFDIIVPAPSMLLQGTETAVEIVRTGNYVTLIKLKEEADIKFTLLLSHVNNALDKDHKDEVQARKQVEAVIYSEKQNKSAALSIVQLTHENEIKKSQAEVEAQQAWISIGVGIAAVIVLYAIISNILIGLVMTGIGICLFVMQVVGVQQAAKNLELAKTRAAIRTKLDSEEIIQQYNLKSMSLGEASKLAEERSFQLQSIKNMLKSM